MTMHKELETWVQEAATLCRPEDVVWCDGADEEYQVALRRMVQARLDRAIARRVMGIASPGSVRPIEAAADSNAPWQMMSNWTKRTSGSPVARIAIECS